MFRTLDVIDSRSGSWLGGNDTSIMIGMVLGLIVGGIAGAAIGIIVALSKARWLLGLLIGTLAGLMIAAYIFLSGTRDEEILRALGGLSIPCLGSVGLLSAINELRTIEVRVNRQSYSLGWLCTKSPQRGFSSGVLYKIRTGSDSDQPKSQLMKMSPKQALQLLES